MLEKEAKEKEKILIAQYKSNQRDFGYNQSLGGEGKTGWITPKETKEKLRQVHLGKKVSQLTRERLSMSHIGKALTPEQRHKISVSAKGKGTKSIIQMSKDFQIIRTWSSITDANKQLGVSISNITSVCKGNRKYAGGYIWKYEVNATN